MAYLVIIDPRALRDVQEAIDYYEEQQPGLGEKFEQVLNRYFLKLEKSPVFQIRYDQVRCLPLKKYPYMIHFAVDEKNKSVTVYAVLHTARTPGIWKNRR